MTFVKTALFHKAGEGSGGGGGGDQHNLGWYATESALTTAHATASDGDWAIVGATDTVWVWDSDTTAWKDTGQAGIELPSQTGNSGKFLTTDGTAASWSDSMLVNSSVVRINTASSYLPTKGIGIGHGSRTNTSTDVSIGRDAGSTTSAGQNISIGNNIWCGNSKYNGIGIGTEGNVQGNYGIGFGYNVHVMADKAFQINVGTNSVTNSDSNTYKFANQNGNFEMMSADGTIPTDRLVHAINKYSTMPTAASTNEGWIVQFTGTTDSTYTHGHLYECVSDGQTPATYSWEAVEVQAGSGGSTTYIPIYKYADDIPVADQSHDGDVFMWGGIEQEWGYLYSGHFYRCDYAPGQGIKSGNVIKYTYVAIPPTPQIYFDKTKMDAYITNQGLPSLTGLKMDLSCIREETALSATITYNMSQNDENQFFVIMNPGDTVADLEQALSDIGLTVDLSAYNFDEPYSDGMTADFYLPTVTESFAWSETKVESNGYVSMPDPNDTRWQAQDNIIQYTGPTTSDYVNGYFYKRVVDDNTGFNVWQQVNVQPAPSGLPDQTGQSGKFLTTDGTDASWSQVLPADVGRTSGSGFLERGYRLNPSAGGNAYIGLEVSIMSGGMVQAKWVIGNQALIPNTSGSYTLGISGRNFGNVYTTKINNGADITVPAVAGELAVKQVNTTITLAAADWSSNTQTVSVTGMTATGVVLVSPDPTDQSAYTSAGIICSAQAAGTLTFTCSTTPSADLSVNVVML